MEYELRTYTIREFYNPALLVQTEDGASQILEAMVKYDMEYLGHTKEVATYLNKKNIKFMAGFYEDEVLERVVRLFHLEVINPYEGMEE